MENQAMQVKRNEMNDNEEIIEKKMKRTKKDKDDLATIFNNRIVSSLKKKDIEETHKVWREVNSTSVYIRPDWISFILHACVVSKDIDFAIEVVNTANEKGVQVMEASYSALINLLCENNNVQEATKYLDIMKKNDVLPRIRTFIPFLTIAKNNGDESLLLSTLERVKEYDLYNDIEIFCYILDTYTNKGDIPMFFKTLQTMSEMFDMGCPSIEASLHTFCELHPEYQCSIIEINDNGECSHCQKKLSKRVLSQSTRKPLYECLENLIRARDRNNTIFNELKDYTLQNQKKIVLDGANIAHYKQNFIGGDFNFEQIYLTIDLLIQDYHYEEKDICIFLHEKHFSDDNEHLNELIRKGMVYKVHKGENDDWFWMYYALYNDIYLLSNDQMRDHFFRMSFPREFKHFREGNQINYDIVSYNDAKHIKLQCPKCYSVSIQIHDEDHIHIPIGKKVDKDGKEYILDKWLCFEKK